MSTPVVTSPSPHAATLPAIEFHAVRKSYFLQEDRTFKDVILSVVHGRSIAKKHVVFENLSFEIMPGETVGIIGKNGAGKSTLLKLIAGVTYPNQGKVCVRGRVAPLIELGAGFHHELSGYENIFLNGAILGMHKKEIEQKVQSIIEFSGLQEYIHVPVKRYSSGMQMRLGFAVAIHVDVPILLIDEVLAVGDRYFQQKCLRALQELKKQKEKTIIFVSHDEKSVESFCDRAILLQAGKMIADGSTEKVLQRYHEL